MKKLLFVLVLLMPALCFAQSIPVEVGGGSIFGEEQEDILRWANVRAVAQVGDVNVPVLPTNAGAVVELGVDAGLIYAVWQTNRSQIGNKVVGADVKVYEGKTGANENVGFDFDYRAVVGYRFSEKLAGYVFLLEDNRPVAFQLTFKLK